MAGFTDAMAIDGKAIVRKLNAGKSLKKGKTSTVQGGLLTIAIPEKNLHIACRLQDVLAVMTAANKAYLENQ